MCMLQESLHASGNYSREVFQKSRMMTQTALEHRECPMGAVLESARGCASIKEVTTFTLPKCCASQNIYFFVLLVIFQKGGLFLSPNSLVSCHYLYLLKYGRMETVRAYFLCFGTKGSFPLKRIGQALEGFRNAQLPCPPANPSQACCSFHACCSGSLSSVVTSAMIT